MKAGEALLFCDETSFELNRRISKIWWIKGERPEVFIDSGRKHLNLIGVIDVTNKLGTFAEIKMLDAPHFLGFLMGLLENTMIQGKIYLVLDNASSHHAKLLEPFLRGVADRLQLIFLPPYSPDFNPIEILWRDLKKDINTNEYFETLDDLRVALREHLVSFKSPSEKINSLWNYKRGKVEMKA
ncbi:MAG: IS630 family transposase [Candidatus Lokiarchaeota archaeon]|nr:IS630 family transposase [Candidatus Lokiarchaeota archaeon]